MIEKFNDLDVDNIKILNLKSGYTQGKLSEDFKDFEDAFNANIKFTRSNRISI